MALKRTSRIACIVALLSATIAAPAQAARHKPKPKPPFSIGIYSGTVTQAVPQPLAGPIRFLVSGRTVSAVNLLLGEQCGGLLYLTVTDAPKAIRIPISSGGAFSYDKTVLGDHLKLKGRLHGRRASGTVFDTLKTGTLQCTMEKAAPFAARH